MSRSRKGAWIEISLHIHLYNKHSVAPARERGLKFSYHKQDSRGIAVAPARERGLKFHTDNSKLVILRRSRKGAWIEMYPAEY